MQTENLSWWYLILTNKKFFLDQHGCAKNQVDGELIISRLINLGMEQTYEPSEADLIVVNSCGFIQSAKEESINSLMDARAEFPEAKIILAGCLAERYAESFEEALPEADGILGNGDLSLLDQTVKNVFENKRTVSKAPQKGVCCGERKTLLSYKGSAFVKITEGCNNRCSFCAIPIIRGELRSRKISDIIDEIKELLSKGIFEINLIGQDLAAFGTGIPDREEFTQTETSHLCALIKEISKLEGKFWIRLLYIHPDHFNADILEVMKKDDRFLHYFDIPFQSGSEAVIHAMNRKGNAKVYSDLINTIRTAFDDACIRTTFLTGFPGEKDEDQENTKNFLNTIQSDWSGCFAYSNEEDTPAEKFKGQVPSKIAKKRSAELTEMQAQITANRLKNRVGKVYDVIIEEIVQNLEGTDEGLAIGRAWFDAPEVDGNFVVRYDLDDKKAVESIVPGNIVKAIAQASSDIDIDGEFIG